MKKWLDETIEIDRKKARKALYIIILTLFVMLWLSKY